MKTFKFFNDGWQQPPIEGMDILELNRALLEDEQIIRFYNDGDYRNQLHSRVIAWARGNYDEWIQREHEGTMERFFHDRFEMEIPVILSIEALIPNGATFTEDDRDYIDYFNFDCPVRIIYYIYESI